MVERQLPKLDTRVRFPSPAFSYAIKGLFRLSRLFPARETAGEQIVSLCDYRILGQCGTSGWRLAVVKVC